MKTKKALLPVLASALLLTMGLAACNNSTPASNPGSSSGEAEEVKIEITSEGGKKEIQVGETLQLTASVEGVTWSTKSADIVSVSETGLVTALKDGSARITAKKDGYANGSFTVTVLKAPEREAKYRLGLEQAEHIAGREEGWGAYFFGQWFSGPFDTPVENNNGATPDGTSIGNLYTGCIEKLTFTSDKAVKVGIGVSMAYANEVNLAEALTIKFNGVAIDLAGKICEAGGENNYYSFHGVELGDVNLVAGNNVLEIELVGSSGVNMDDVLIYTNETLQLSVVPAAVKPKIEVVEADIEIQVDAEAQIQVKDNLAGVAYASADETIATVSTAGVVKGIKAGKTKIEVTKEGYRKATVNVTVTAKPVAGQIVLEAEDAVIPEGSTIQVENQKAASGGKSIGYFSEGQTFSIKYTAEAAKTMNLSLVAAACEMDPATYAISDMNLAESLSLTLNGTAVSLEGKTLPGNSSFNFANFQEVELGAVDLVAGENTFVFTALKQGPNVDCIKLTDPNASQGGGQVTPPTVETVAVTFDAGGGTGEMAAVDVEKGSEYTLPACTFTAPAGMIFAGWSIPAANWWEAAQIKQPGEKITVSAALKLTASWVKESITVTFSAGDGTGTMAPVTVRGGEYTLPACTFTAPGTKVFGGWQIVTTNQWGQQQTQIKQPGEKINLTDDLTLTASWKVNIIKSAQVDLSSAFVMEAEEAVIAGAQTQQGGSPVESNESSHGGKDVGYMSAGASITFNFNASAAGQVKLVLMGRSANADWSNWQNPTYYDHALEETTSIKANDADVDVTGKGFLGSDAKTSVQIDLGNIAVKAGANTIVVSALQQAPNIDCIALIADGITFTLPQA